MAGKRLFIAIPIPEEVRRELASCRNLIAHPGLRWTPPDNLHITLLFLGNVNSEEISRLREKLTGLIPPAAFHLHCRQVTAVKRRGKTAMLWAGFEENAHFVNLAVQVAQVLDFPLAHPPLPHVTLARVKGGSPVRLDICRFPEISHLTFNVNTFGLWEPVLQPGGAVYLVLSEWQLQKGNAAL